MHVFISFLLKTRDFKFKFTRHISGKLSGDKQRKILQPAESLASFLEMAVAA
jgi:hypothetical protein